MKRAVFVVVALAFMLTAGMALAQDTPDDGGCLATRRMRPIEWRWTCKGSGLNVNCGWVAWYGAQRAPTPAWQAWLPAMLVQQKAKRSGL